MPKLLRYKESYCAKAHAIGISCVAFSSQGSYLATAGLDGKVCIWEVKEFRLRYVYKSETPVLTALWLPNGEDSVLLGYQDGHVATLTHTSVSGTVRLSYSVHGIRGLECRMCSA